MLPEDMMSAAGNVFVVSIPRTVCMKGSSSTGQAAPESPDAAALRAGSAPAALPDFRLLFESAPGLYLALRNDPPCFTIVGASNAYLAATLTERSAVLGRGLFEVFPDDPDDPAADGARNLRVSLMRVVATRAADTMAVQKYAIRRPDDSGFEERFWSPVNSPVMAGDGSFEFIIHRVQDVTEFVRLKQLGSEQSRLTSELQERANAMEAEVMMRAQQLQKANEKLRDANQHLDELDRAKTAFFNNISHEFRTPLTLILGLVEAALEHPDGALEGAELVTVNRNAERLLRLVNNLLEFARLEAGRIETAFEPVELSSLTTDIASNFRSLIERAGLAFRVSCPPLSQPVYVDRQQWEKILLNLISNAYKFTLSGEIAVTLAERGDRVVLQVKDTGLGIAASEMPRLFERFHRITTRSGRSFEGSGIGLALVREFVTLHGGTIEVDSVEGRGSSFNILIPTGSAHLPQDRVAPARLQVADGASPTPKGIDVSSWLSVAEAGEVSIPAVVPTDNARILVVDDNADMRAYLTRLLERHWRVETAVDGLVAVAAARANPPDLILSDIMMPGLDGFGLLKELRRDERLASVPVILLSARAGEEALIEGLDTGADDYLVKPFSARELFSRVRTHLEMSRTRRAAAETAAALAEMRARLLHDIERKNRELAAFSYSVSHDLRAPLRSIDGFSQALLEDYEHQLEPKAVDYLNRVRAAGQQMGLLIDDLLRLSRVERSEMVLTPIDLSRKVADICAELRRQHPAREISLRIEAGLEAQGDARLLRIALANLLGNAWKFTAHAAEAVVSFGSEVHDGATAFYVRDNGAGFDMNYAGNLFQPFQRLHTVTEYPGTGIGLATVQRIIERHGGTVWAEGKPGVGATFYFTLPSSRTGLAVTG